ncbi:hypothetical protein [Sulfitobacter sp. M22]|uniref:hypothetical protein n=1 Tax=Sulfitobacter sp. M22 TaxID=2675332 RepID=UPI001F1C2639|nr:hypothetical protein [Sulfitobacter sp. M22]MCF7725738.1 hypothetical protein [Sulfitobacter sp. M22]
MPAIIDIRARVFTADDHAYRLFPGVSYKHFAAMRDLNVVFLDYPGLPMPPPEGFKQGDYEKEMIVRGSLYASVAYRNDDLVKERMAEIASRDLSSTRWSRNRQLALSWINALYHSAKIGDLIVVPGPLNRRGEEDDTKTLIGEITTGPVRLVEANDERYRNAGLLVRRIRWLSEIDDRDLDHRTSRSLRTQNALVSLPVSALRPVLGAAYKNVIVDGDFLARFITQGAEFTARESYHFQAFVLAVVEAYSRIEKDSSDLPDSIYAMAAQVARNAQGVPEQDFSIHSPGYTTLKGSRVVFVVAALFATALSTTAEPFGPDGKKIDVKLENTASGAYDPCEPEGLEKEVRETFRVMDFDRWQELCRAARAANEDEGFEPVSSAK